MSNVKQFTDKLEKLNYENMYNGDFFLTWEKTDDEIQAVYEVADALRHLRENNVSTKIFDSGLGISLFRDNSTRTRFSSLPPATCWAWKCRTWTRARAR